jgi:GAF domain-containing protein
MHYRSRPARRTIDFIAAAPLAQKADDRFLVEIISTVASSLNLEEVLEAVVKLLSDASAVHACFVYLLDDEERRLVLRAASEPYDHLAGRIALEHGRGLAWWALEHREPVYIREGALDDPRFAYVPELEEERFQSLVAGPRVGRLGDSIGSITMQTEAPREFTEAEASFLASSASLVAGAIENARLHAETKRRVDELEQLAALAEALARAEAGEDLAPDLVERACRLLAADSVHLYLLREERDRHDLIASHPADATARATLGLTDLGPELDRDKVTVPLVAAGELLGVLAAVGTNRIELARAVANQTAVAMKKIELIERLTEKNLIKDFLEHLAHGKGLADVDRTAERLGIDLTRPHVVVAARPASDALERALAGVAPGSLFDRQENVTRGVLRVPAGGAKPLVEEVRRAHRELGEATAVGISNPCVDAASFPAGFEEADHALLGTTILRNADVVAFEELGPYKYLLRMSLQADPRDAHRQAIGRLADYDERHGTQLLATLEEFLTRRGAISATADALYIHPNTLRQRLRRINELTGLDLRREDGLLIEIAVRLARLERTVAARPHMSGAPRV